MKPAGASPAEGGQDRPAGGSSQSACLPQKPPLLYLLPDPPGAERDYIPCYNGPLQRIRSHCLEIWLLMERFPTTGILVKKELDGILEAVQEAEAR